MGEGPGPPGLREGYCWDQAGNTEGHLFLFWCPKTSRDLIFPSREDSGDIWAKQVEGCKN